MNFSKAMVHNAFKLILTALLLGVALRAVSVRFFYDYSTGFYSDHGVTAWLSILVPLTLVVAAALFSKSGVRALGTYRLDRHPLVGVLSALAGGVLVVSAVVMAGDYKTFLDTGFSQFDSVRQGFNHVFYIAACLLLGLVQLATAAAFLSGRDIFQKLPLLYAAGVLWGVSYMVMVYVFYAKSSSVAENIFSMGGAAALLLSLLYLCRLLAGVEARGAGLRLYICGGAAVVLNIPYYGVDLVQRLLGYSYSGQVPPQCQLNALALALFVLAFMGTCRSGESAAEEPEGRHFKPKSAGE